MGKLQRLQRPLAHDSERTDLLRIAAPIIIAILAGCTASTGSPRGVEPSADLPPVEERVEYFFNGSFTNGASACAAVTCLDALSGKNAETFDTIHLDGVVTAATAQLSWSSEDSMSALRFKLIEGEGVDGKVLAVAEGTSPIALEASGFASEGGFTVAVAAVPSVDNDAGAVTYYAPTTYSAFVSLTFTPK